MSLDIPRVKLIEDKDIIVTSLRDCLLRWWKRTLTRILVVYRQQLKHIQGIPQATNHCKAIGEARLIVVLIEIFNCVKSVGRM